MQLTADGADELRAIVRGFVERHLATEIGAVALDVPEELGGAGAGGREVAVLAEELGRSPARLPWYSTAGIDVGLLATCRSDRLPAVLDGTRTATLAYREGPAGWDPDAVATTATDGRLTGTKTLVVEGATGDLLLVAARTGDDLGVFAVDADADGLTRTPLRAMDPNRQLARVELDATPAVRLDEPRTAGPLLAAAMDRALVVLAGEQLGGAAAALDAAVG